MELPEILRALELAPGEQKLAALGELNSHPDPNLLAQLRDPLSKLAFGGTASKAVRFYATRALVVLGDQQDSVLAALEALFGEQVLSDHNDKMITFPWVPALGTTEGASNLDFRLRCNVSYSVVETLSRLRGSERAAAFLKKLIDDTDGTETRILYIYAMGAIGHESSRPTLEYFKEAMSGSPEGKAAAAALQRFGISSFFDLVGSPTAPSKSGCFVVTALSGGPGTAEVRVCRDFRDRVLAPSHVGRALIGYYYEVGPKLAEFFVNRPLVRSLTRRIVLRPAVWIIANCLYHREYHSR